MKICAKEKFCILFVIVSLICSGCNTKTIENESNKQNGADTNAAIISESKDPKYIFYFIGDGMGASHRALGEDYLKYKNEDPNQLLAMNDMPVTGIVTTHSANSLLTDSPAGGTALATGKKTNFNMLSVSPDGNTEYKTLLEAAKEKGMTAALITQVTITDATPATFGGHAAGRMDESSFANQYLDLGIDYLAGGGLCYYLPGDEGGLRQDGKNMIEEYEENGYTVLTSREQFANAEFHEMKKCLGLYAYEYFPDELTQINTSRTTPELFELVGAGIDVCSKNPEGFFMMCEGGLIDIASHNNDTASAIEEVLALDKAVNTAIEFYHQYPDETLIIVTADHETGGLGIGNNTYRIDFEPLEKVNSSILTIMLNTEDNLDAFYNAVQNAWDMKFTDEDMEMIDARIKSFDLADLTSSLNPEVSYDDYANAQKEMKGISHMITILGWTVSPIMTEQTKIGWSTQTHTAEPVPLTAIGVGADKFCGYIDNTDVAKIVAEIFDLDIG